MKRLDALSTFRAWLAATALAWAGAAAAHDFRLGPLVLDHPYATVAPGGAAVYFRTVKNTGPQADRLLAARSAVAGAVEIQRDGKPAAAIELPAHSEQRLRHDGATRLALLALKAPLQDGQCFALWLRFEHAGAREVDVCVVTPRDGGAAHHH